MIGDKDIVGVLNSWLAQFPASPPVAWEGLEFNPASQTYLKESYLPARFSRGALSMGRGAVLSGQDLSGAGGVVLRRGVYQVDVFSPENKGLILPLGIADALVAWFHAGRRMSRGGVQVRIDDLPYTSGAMQEAGWLQVPVTVPWNIVVGVV